jgi:glycosyltransferase involved in cell wall biosynthesis
VRLALHLGTLRGHGSAVVGRGVLAGLTAQVAGHELLAFVPREWRLPPAPHLTLRETGPGLLAKLVTDNLSVRGALAGWRADRLFSLGDTSLPLCPVPHLLLVQQAFLAYPPGDWGFTPPPRFRARMLAMAAYLRAALPSVRAVTVQSEAMKQNFAARWRFPEARIHVVPSAIEAPPAVAPEAGQAPYLAYVASAAPHKDHALLAPMMAALQRRHPALVCRVTVAREDVPTLAREAKLLGARIEFLGALPRERALALLAGAAVVVAPSRLESFGIPYFEALAFGRPQVASDRPFAREACGDAALYAPAGDAEAFADAVDRALASSGELERRARLRFAQLTRGWDAVARDYLTLLEAL